MCFGGDSVDLTHIASFVLLLDIVDVQIPTAMAIMFVVRHTDAWIACYHVIVYGQYGRLFEVHPSHLYKTTERIQRPGCSRQQMKEDSGIRGSHNKQHEIKEKHKQETNELFCKILHTKGDNLLIITKRKDVGLTPRPRLSK